MSRRNVASLVDSLIIRLHTLWRFQRERKLISIFLQILGVYALLQGLLGWPNLVDATKHLLGKSWKVDVGPTRLWGSVLLLRSTQGADSIAAWSDSELMLSIKIENRVTNGLRIDSIKVFDEPTQKDLSYDFRVEKGNLQQYRDSYILAGAEEVDLSLRPMEIKENIRLLESFLNGSQILRVYTERGINESKVIDYTICDQSGKILKKIGSTN